jgi:predicted ester cyclase
MAEDGTTLVRRFIEEMINGNNLALVDELFTPGYVDRTPGAPPVPPGPAGMRDTVNIFRAAFPNDMHYTIEDLFGAGDRVAVRWTARGTNTGPLMGLPPTGKQVAVSAVYIFRVEDGKLAEAWGDFDALGMQQQLGLLPAPGGAAPPSEGTH